MMKTIFSLVALLLLGTANSFAQFSSTPMEPGLRDHLNGRKQGAVQVLDDRRMEINGVAAEWVSQDQITLSAVVVEVSRLSEATLERVSRQILEYNISAAVGTLSLEQGAIRMTHHVNPRYVSPAGITSTVAAFKAAVEKERTSFDKSMAAIR